jgi:hypothetical protein
MRRISLVTVLAAGALGLLPSSASAVAGNFFQPVTSPESAGDAGRAILSADFDGDTKTDLAVSNVESNDVTLLKGDSTGDFVPFASSPLTGAGAWDLIAADIDNDLDQDLIAVDTGNPGTVRIFRNNGSGVFAAPLTETVGNQPRHVVAAHLNGDSYIDLAVANFGAATVNVLLNNGDTDMVPDGIGNGDFTVGSAIPLHNGTPGDTNITGLAAAAIDNIGPVDLVVSRGFSNDIKFLSGNGNGTFGSPIGLSLGMGSGPGDIAVGNFNGGFPDLAITQGNSNIAVLNGVGDGTFTHVVGSPFSVGSSPSGSTVNGIVTADLDGDTDLDLAATVGFNAAASRVVIFQGNGAGGFSMPATSPENVGNNIPIELTVGDFNGANLDLAVSNVFPQPVGVVNILLNDSTFTLPAAPSVNGTNPGTGANENNPKVFGTAEAASTVSLFANGTCTPPAAISGPAATFASPGFTVPVADNSTTTFSAQATNGEGTSLCSTVNATYQEVTPPASGGGGTTTPAKKCKKGQIKRKGKCVKKKKKKKKK